MSPNEVVRRLSIEELRASAGDALQWRRKGVLTGQALLNVARRLVVEAGIDEFDANRMADALVIEEAAARFAQQKE